MDFLALLALSPFFFFTKKLFEQIELRSYWTDFHQIFTLWYDRRLPTSIWPPFPMAQGTLPWQPMLWSKLAKSDYSPLFVAVVFRKDCNIGILIFKSSYVMIWLVAALFVNLVNFGPVTAEFTKVKAVHSSKLRIWLLSIAQETLPWQPIFKGQNWRNRPTLTFIHQSSPWAWYFETYCKMLTKSCRISRNLNDILPEDSSRKLP